MKSPHNAENEETGHGYDFVAILCYDSRGEIQALVKGPTRVEDTGPKELDAGSCSAGRRDLYVVVHNGG